MRRLNPALNSTLVLAITGPNNYYFYDMQRVNIPADLVAEYSSSWQVPNTTGRYVLEVSTIPAMLTVYDAVWLGAVT